LTSTLSEDALGEDYDEYDPSDEPEDPFAEETEGEERKHTTNFMDADIGEFIKRPKTATARAYEKKTQAILNAGMRFTIKSPQTLPDAAAFIAYGDEVAAAAGEFAEDSEFARKTLDFITAPENSAVVFALAVLPLVSQLYRNHHDLYMSAKQRQQVGLPEGTPLSRKERRAQRKAQRAARPGIKVGFGRFKYKLPFTVEMFGSNISRYAMSQSVDPPALAKEVFSNQKVVAALKKRGINIGS
jgi:hypothetical protein